MNLQNPLHYIAANNPEAVLAVLEAYNIPAPTVEDEIYDAVDYLTLQYGKDAAEDIFALHPDANDIMASKRFSYTAARSTVPIFAVPLDDKQRAFADKIKQDALGKVNGNGNGNGIDIQDRWILITLLLIAVFALGRWLSR